MRYWLILLLSLFCLCANAQDKYPCVGTTTTRLNVRNGPGTNYERVLTLQEGCTVKVVDESSTGWLIIDYAGVRGYVHPSYVKLSPLPKKVPEKKKSSTSVGWTIAKYALAAVAIYVIALLFFGLLTYGSFVYLGFIRFVSTAFYVFNWLQRFIHKPWYLLLKFNRRSDATNKTLRIVTGILKFPLYFLGAPLRFFNAVFYNIFIHCLYELYNYSTEVLYPTSRKEGVHSPRVPHLLLWRIIKYPIWHGTLTVIESLFWVVMDTIFPALTLYHGTSARAVADIVSSPNRHQVHYYDVGIWKVGSGNFAGNGIYFAPILSTAQHYSKGAIIVSRVTLGRVIDLGLAPGYVFRECGHANAFNATRWGLNNRYVTGEWWRADAGWWEFCMYDWQNRYNYSWRIRPLYVIDSSDRGIVRIGGGMQHWLFNKMVISDLFSSLFK